MTDVTSETKPWKPYPYADLLAWIDIETTGLDPSVDDILEIGIILTTPAPYFKVVAAYHSVTLLHSRILLNDVTRPMHEENGLLKYIEAVHTAVDSDDDDTPHEYPVYQNPIAASSDGDHAPFTSVFAWNPNGAAVHAAQWLKQFLTEMKESTGKKKLDVWPAGTNVHFDLEFLTHAVRLQGLDGGDDCDDWKTFSYHAGLSYRHMDMSTIHHIGRHAWFDRTQMYGEKDEMGHTYGASEEEQNVTEDIPSFINAMATHPHRVMYDIRRDIAVYRMMMYQFTIRARKPGAMR